VKPSRILAGFLCSALASIAGMFLPFILHGVRNLPWEVIFGFAFYITGFFRSALGEHLEAFIGGVLWPFAVIALVWFAGARLWAAGRLARLASLSVFVLSLLLCVSSQTANSLATRIPLYLNESYVRF
jgi:hypothetical protein